MFQLIMIFHIIISVALIALVLVQHGKGAGMGASFGGGNASNTVFGSAGTMPFLVKVTSFFAMMFFVTSLTIGYMVSHPTQSGLVRSVDSGVEVGKRISIPVSENKKNSAKTDIKSIKKTRKTPSKNGVKQSGKR